MNAVRCTALGIYVDWWPEQRVWHFWTRWLNWPSRSRQEGPLWVHGALNVENEMRDDPGTALAEAVDIAKAQADGAGAAWSDPAIIVTNSRQQNAAHTGCAGM